MGTLHAVVVTAVAVWVGYSAYAVLSHQPWVVDNLADYGVDRRWWRWLGVLKGLGAAGLLTGVWAPALGLAAAVGLTGYFVGAVITVLHARCYRHVAYPLLFLAPVVAAGVLLAAG
ncbi:DoxX family protein [Nocardioides sp.]|uniref:DoxX family protein n=1 Tax=Nocardioides sp. TaxID=35761 RepID=UPI002ED90D2D